MGALTDALIAATDPLTTLILIVVGAYIRMVKNTLRRDIRKVRGRVERIESGYIPDGGSIEEGE